MFGFLKSVSCRIQMNLNLLRNENQNVLFTCIVFFLSLDECTFKRTVDIDCIRISKRIYRPCLRRVSRNATRFCIIYTPETTAIQPAIVVSVVYTMPRDPTRDH